jgi:histidyl-tRNA synthetase
MICMDVPAYSQQHTKHKNSGTLEGMDELNESKKVHDLSTEPYKGVRDFYPAEWSKLSQAFETIRHTLGLWGYEEYNASPLERAELYESKTSEEIVNEQTYTFMDRGDRKVTLRPEMTPTFARMVAAKRREVPFPLRWFSIPNVFRYERPQRGRLREHYQLNVDLAGIADAKADSEMIVIASEVLKAFGATNEDFVIRVSSRTLLEAACKASGFDTPEAIKNYSRLLDRKRKMTVEEFADAIGEGRSDPLKAIENADAAEGDQSVAEEKAKLFALIESLHQRGMTNVVFDPEIVRGFDYYTGMVFEIFDSNTENPRSICGGGRYDGLVEMFGGDAIPCVGFAIGDVTLMDFLETHDLAPIPNSAPQLYIGTPQESDFFAAQTFAQSLRMSGVRVIVHTPEENKNKSLGDQIRDASRRGIPYFLAYGEQELTSGTVRLKTLASSEEDEVSAEDVAARIFGKSN